MRIGILGMGRLGTALVELCSQRREYSEIFAFSRREKNREGRVWGTARIFPLEQLYEGAARVDILLLAHSSKGEILSERLDLQRRYTTVDAFDVHGVLRERREEIDRVARASKTVGIVGVGWDPGVLSLARTLCRGIFPNGKIRTRWGEGVSEGHSSAIRAIEGVKRAVQYTVPTEDGHRRVCFVVCDDGREEQVACKIKEMPEYFLPYDTEVNFISEEEFLRSHEGAHHHRGSVCGQGDLAGAASVSVEVKMQSNPHFTASVMLAYARAARTLAREGSYGAYGPLELPLGLLAEGTADLW